MKKIFLAVLALVAIGCSSKSDVARSTAQDFLDAFLANDYSGAASHCSEEFQSDFNKILEDYVNLDEKIKGIIKEQCSLYEAQIDGVERVNESDTFKVNYSIVKSTPDTASFEQGAPARNTLTVVDGKVIRLN